ncbi:alkene reductase [Herbaspirillum frisingense]|uniref:alkene reductase n=1 Tax=Herbaspirillum frisingense TaxID=92645 RepID=UPI001F39F717|nr:alkene reductase [Herbaspirillum frisingense]UIN19927.1 alkene reductase [Herbaspirillum frisingense]
MTNANTSANANANVHASSDLFKPVQLGAVQLQNRIVMAPLTRSRAQAGDVPTPVAAEYYAQRASAGLIIAEATQISPQGKGYAWTPGIYDQAQVAGWKKITDAVHAKGGRIFLQLWHVGRISHPDLQPGHALPVAPSAVKPEGNAFTETGFKPFVEPRALELSELPALVEQYKTAAQLAIQAGFDGVEIHAANGYLLDQFLRDKTNQRTDAYGGSIENRARLLLEVVAAVTSVVPSERVGIRLSPISPANDIADSDPKALFSYVVQQLNRYKLVYLHVVEGATGGPREVAGGFDLQVLRDLFQGIYIANNGYDLEMAAKARQGNRADLVAFGRPFIANPDLVERFKAGAALADFNQATLYGGGAEGYTDYPTMQAS